MQEQQSKAIEISYSLESYNLDVFSNTKYTQSIHGDACIKSYCQKEQSLTLINVFFEIISRKHVQQCEHQRLFL